MDVSQMMSTLATRLKDPDGRKWTPAEKLVALNNAQIKLSNLIDPGYSEEKLGELQTNVSVTSGVVTLSSDLTETLLRGKKGIMKVKVYNGKEMIESDISDTKRFENPLQARTLDDPGFYIFGDKLYTQPASIAAVDIYHIRVPNPLLYGFSHVAAGTPANDTFAADADQDLSAVNDYYNGAVIFSWQFEEYFIVDDYVGATREFSFLETGDANFGTNTFYFLTHGFDGLNLANLTCELGDALHEVMVSLAEGECWGMSEDGIERKASVLDTAYKEIALLNERHEKAQGIGKKSQK